MWNFIVGIIFTVFISWSGVESHNLPSYITPCKRSEQNFLQCIEKNVDVVRPKLKEGIPDLFIPSIDPLIIPPITLNGGDKVKVTFQDINIFHINRLHIDQFDIDLENHKVNLTITFPALRISAKFNITGKFLIVHINRNGPADGNYTNFQLHLGLKGTPYTENEIEHLKWEKETISIRTGQAHVVLENIFGNHTDIKDEVNKAINDNIKDIIDDLQPVLQKVITDLVISVINKLFSNYSVKELFVD